MKKRTSKKELEAKINELEKKLSTFNVLFGMYVGFKGDSKEFQVHLDSKLRGNDGKVL